MKREMFDSLRKFGPTQDDAEFFWLVNLVEDLNPHVIIEIGIENGGSLKYWEQVLKPGDLLIGIDTHPELLEWDVEASDRDVRIIEGNSQDSEVIDQAEEILSGRKVDFVFQDGDHGYFGVKRDFENFSKLLRKGGIFAIHDIKAQFDQAGRFFEELESEYSHTAKMKKGQGTGVWWKP